MTDKHEEMALELIGVAKEVLSVAPAVFTAGTITHQSLLEFATVLASALRQVERETLENRQDTVYLTPPMLREALEFFTPDKTADEDETEITIGYLNHVLDDDGKDTGRHLCVWFAEYPEEGVMPLSGEGYEFKAPTQSADVPTPTELVDGSVRVPRTGWNQDGNLLYRLKDGGNYDEINVSQAKGSRSMEDRTKRAAELLAMIQAAPDTDLSVSGEVIDREYVRVPILLDCPFCGADGETIDPHGWEDGDGRHGPQCLDCGATAESYDDWNRRAP